MERKRKVIAPFFRMPNPSNPITGDAHYLHPPLKQFVAFELEEELTTGTESAKARIADSSQWGTGLYHCSDVIIHVHNQPSALDAHDYLFEGTKSNVGLAAHDCANHWRIIWMKPEPLPGYNAVAYTTSIIPGRVGTTPGGPIAVQRKKIAGATPTLVDDGAVNVWSWASSDSLADVYIFIEQDTHGIWWFTGEDCAV